MNFFKNEFASNSTKQLFIEILEKQKTEKLWRKIQGGKIFPNQVIQINITKYIENFKIKIKLIGT